MYNIKISEERLGKAQQTTMCAAVYTGGYIMVSLLAITGTGGTPPQGYPSAQRSRPSQKRGSVSRKGSCAYCRSREAIAGSTSHSTKPGAPYFATSGMGSSALAWDQFHLGRKSKSFRPCISVVVLVGPSSPRSWPSFARSRGVGLKVRSGELRSSGRSAEEAYIPPGGWFNPETSRRPPERLMGYRQAGLAPF